LFSIPTEVRRVILHREIFVGENSTSSGTNLLETTKRGHILDQVTGTGAVPTGWLVNRAGDGSDGNLYVAYAQRSSAHRADQWRNNALQHVHARLGERFYRLCRKRSGAPYDDFGYCGIALDPKVRRRSPSPAWTATTTATKSGARQTPIPPLHRGTALFSSNSTTAPADTTPRAMSPMRPGLPARATAINNWACTVRSIRSIRPRSCTARAAEYLRLTTATSASTLTRAEQLVFP